MITIIAFCGFSLHCAHADLGAGIRRKEAGGAVTPAPWSSPFVVPLQKVTARTLDGKTNADAGSFFVGDIFVGQPAQKLRVAFDTSSGNVIVPHRACQDRACRTHHRYSPWSSHSSVNVNVNGDHVRANAPRDVVNISFTQADLGTGSAVGVLVSDHVCLEQNSEHKVCTKLNVVAARSLDDMPFLAMPNDGIVGLGLSGLMVGPGMSFFGKLMEGSTGVPPQFGISLGANGGEVFFGGYNSAYTAAPLQWFQVLKPEMGYWQVALRAVRFGNSTVDACSDGCSAIIDTSIARVGVQNNRFAKLRAALISTPVAGGGCKGPDLEFDLGGLVITLHAEDYADALCQPALGTLALEDTDLHGTYAFGEVVLHEYYAAFDWGSQRVGLAPAVGRHRRHGRDEPSETDVKAHIAVEAIFL